MLARTRSWTPAFVLLLLTSMALAGPGASRSARAAAPATGSTSSVVGSTSLSGKTGLFDRRAICLQPEGTGVNAVDLQWLHDPKFGNDSIDVRLSDPDPGNQGGTTVHVYRNGGLIETFDLTLSAASSDVALPVGEVLLATDELRVTAREHWTPASSPSCARFVGPLAETETMHANTPDTTINYFLEDSADSDDQGCHAQGIKFDGAYFYTSCQETTGNNEALAFIHDSLGKRLCRFTLGDDYSHPGGILLKDGGAYVGFSGFGVRLNGTIGPLSRLVHVSYRPGEALPCRIEHENFGGLDLPDSAGFVVAVPSDGCNEALPRNVWVYDNVGDDHFECGTDGDVCWGPYDGDAPTNPNHMAQDCQNYWDDGWYRACITLSHSPNHVNVYKAHRVSTAYWVKRLELSGPGYSGGFGFYEVPGGDAYLLHAAHSGADSANCFDPFPIKKLPCTDRDRRQVVKFQYMDDYDWPGGFCSEPPPPPDSVPGTCACSDGTQGGSCTTGNDQVCRYSCGGNDWGAFCVPD